MDMKQNIGLKTLVIGLMVCIIEIQHAASKIFKVCLTIVEYYALKG